MKSSKSIENKGAAIGKLRHICEYIILDDFNPGKYLYYPISDKYILNNHCPYLEKRMCVCYNWFASQIVWLGGEWIGSTKRRASDGKADPAGLCQAVSGKRIPSDDHDADSKGGTGFLQQLSEPFPQQGRYFDGTGEIHV